jgi:hypothetical protein
MSNGLFVRSYPAAGVQIVPATYSVARSAYFLELIPLLLFLLAGPRNLSSARWLFPVLLIYAFAMLFAGIFLRRLRLGIRTDGITYTNISARERFLFFSDISTVVLFTNQWSSGRGRWPSFRMPGSMVITSKLETGTPALKIPLYLFPDAAKAQLTHLLRPEEWDTDS